MKFILVTLVGLALVSEFAWARSNSLEWSIFKRQFNKSYANQEEEARRFANFMATKALVDAHNADPSNSYKLGINHMADWHEEEKAKMLSYRHDPSQVVSELSTDDQAYVEAIIGDEEPPAELDWRKVPGRVGDIKNQGNCGSCWAFATTGVLEGQQVVRNITHKLIPLSEQDLIDCSKQNDGCDGGVILYALQDIAKMGGIDSEEVYPYSGNNSQCQFRREKSVMTIKSSVMLPAFKEDLLKKMVAKFGPISTGVYATRSFQHYKRGVFNDKTCPSAGLNHAVLIVGYGTDAIDGDYWIIKNSWGEDWGEAGYIRLERGKNRCAIAITPTIPKF